MGPDSRHSNKNFQENWAFLDLGILPDKLSTCKIAFFYLNLAKSS